MNLTILTRYSMNSFNMRHKQKCEASVWRASELTEPSALSLPNYSLPSRTPQLKTQVLECWVSSLKQGYSNNPGVI